MCHPILAFYIVFLSILSLVYRYTQRDGNVYGIVLFWPKQELLYLHDPLPSNKTVITLLGYPESLSVSFSFLIFFFVSHLIFINIDEYYP